MSIHDRTERLQEGIVGKCDECEKIITDKNPYDDMKDGRRLCKKCIEKEIADKKDKVKFHIFGVISSLVDCNEYSYEGAARFLYDEVLSDYNYEELRAIILEMDPDIMEAFESFYRNQIEN